jgi:hypothetical protein
LASLSGQPTGDRLGLRVTGGGQRRVTPSLPVPRRICMCLPVSDEENFGHVCWKRF